MARTLNIIFLLSCLFCATAAFMAPLSSASRQASSRTAVWGTRDNVVMMPATLEREAVKIGGPATLERPETQQKERVQDPVKERKSTGGEAWEVRIYNDGLNTREHVARSLVQVTGMSEVTAYQTMMQAHQNGIAAVGRWCYEVAEMYHGALQTNGIVCDLVEVEEDN